MPTLLVPFSIETVPISIEVRSTETLLLGLDAFLDYLWIYFLRQQGIHLAIHRAAERGAGPITELWMRLGRSWCVWSQRASRGVSGSIATNPGQWVSASVRMWSKLTHRTDGLRNAAAGEEERA